MKVSLILATMFLAACADSSAPAAPNFVVVNTDWRGTSAQPVAHGIFRNQGAGGSAVVTFSIAVKSNPLSSHGNETKTFSCNTVVKAEAGQAAEASCPMPEPNMTQFWEDNGRELQLADLRSTPLSATVSH